MLQREINDVGSETQYCFYFSLFGEFNQLLITPTNHDERSLTLCTKSWNLLVLPVFYPGIKRPVLLIKYPPILWNCKDCFIDSCRLTILCKTTSKQWFFFSKYSLCCFLWQTLDELHAALPLMPDATHPGSLSLLLVRRRWLWCRCPVSVQWYEV